MIRTLVVDDSASLLAAAAEVVSAADGFELAGTAQSGEEAVELVRSLRPDFALIDFNMPGMSGGGDRRAAGVGEPGDGDRGGNCDA